MGKLRKTESPEKLPSKSSQTNILVTSRNATIWTLSTLLIFPAFFIFYFLKNDLTKHEMHEHDFLVEVIELAKDSNVPLDIHGFSTTTSFPLSKYLALNIITCGLASTYWLYRIFNDYNNHFKMQWKNEDGLLSFLKEIDKESVHN